MSDSSDEDDQRKAGSASRMWAESQPGPSRCQPSRQGYCGYCRVLYGNLDQHLSSLRHLDSVRASSRGSSTVSSTSSSRTKLTLLERFLQDVLQHHPHRYKDPRPSHADLPSVSAPLLPREEFDELCFSDKDSRSPGNHEHLPSSNDASCQPTNQREDDGKHSQSEGVVQERESAPVSEQGEGGTASAGCTHASQAQAPPPVIQAPPTVHRKAHRKTNRRKTSESSSSSLPHRAPDTGLSPGSGPYPGPGLTSGHSPQPVPGPGPSLTLGSGPCPGPSLTLGSGPCPGPSLTLGPGPCPGPSLTLGPGPCPGPSLTLGPGPCPGPSLTLGPGPCPGPSLTLGPGPCPGPSLTLGPGPCPGPSLTLGPGPCPGPGPVRPSSAWLSWQKERREAHKEEAFSSDHSDPLDQTIEEVIQMCCYGISSTTCQQEETESFHLSLPVSMETQSDDWDTPVQVDLQPGQTHTSVQVSHMEEQDLSRLMDVQVDLEDQVYSYQLDSALRSERRARGGARQDEGFWTLPIEEVLPAPAHIPESFRGKTWAQIEQEDEEKVNKLVRQFRREKFICYFDSESLARYGRRSQNKKGCGDKGVETDSGILPLLDCDEDNSVYLRRRRRRKGRAFRVASRCQVVKVSHSTQTVRLVVPAVRQSASEAPPTSISAANQDAGERTPDAQTWRCLPPSYSNIITPVQPRTSLVYLLCSPSGPTPTETPATGSAPKRCRKKRRPLDQEGLKVKYKQLPVRFYEPSSNRILKNPPKGFLWRRGSTPSSPPPPCVRQLFRSLSPDLNTEGAAGSSRVKRQRSSDATFSHAHSFLLSTLSGDAVRRRGRTSQAPPPSPHTRSERGRGGRRGTRPTPTKRRTRAQATPPQPRREGLRRTGPGATDPPPPPSPRRGRGRRGRGCERSRR